MASKNGLSRPLTTITSCFFWAAACPALSASAAAASNINVFLMDFPPFQSSFTTHQPGYQMRRGSPAERT